MGPLTKKEFNIKNFIEKKFKNNKSHLKKNFPKKKDSNKYMFLKFLEIFLETQPKIDFY